MKAGVIQAYVCKYTHTQDQKQNKFVFTFQNGYKSTLTCKHILCTKRKIFIYQLSFIKTMYVANESTHAQANYPQAKKKVGGSVGKITKKPHQLDNQN